MNTQKNLLVLVVFLIASGSAFAEYKSPTEAQCREMVTGMLQVMRSTPLQNDNEKRQHRELMERVEKVVNDNRSRPGSDCETWAAMSKIIATQ
ncbi:MAG: hypothetical protein IPP41_03915 [Rhodocyclaceae bacterium]|nr:hypothetical protein [Rhodocyclaceae bacterium]